MLQMGFDRGCSGMFCLLFNIILEKVIWDTRVQTHGTIFYKLTQLLENAYELYIVAKHRNAMYASFLATKEVFKQMGLQINQSKTKYMQFTDPMCYVLLMLATAVLTEILVTQNNDVSKKIRATLTAANGVTMIF